MKDNSLKLTESEFAKAFAVFRSKSDQRDLMLDWINQQLASLLPKKETSSVLSIGSGNGDFDLCLIPLLKKQVHQLRYVGVEPNGLFCNEFSKKLHQLGYPDLDWTVNHSRFEQACFSEQFHLIHFTHCLYHIPARRRALQETSNLLYPGGVLLIFNSTQIGIQGIRQKFMAKARGDAEDIYTCEQLQMELDQAGMGYQYMELESTIEVTECLAAEPQENPLLDFLLECRTSDLSPDLYGEIIDHIKELSVEKEGGRHIPNPVGVLMIAA